MTKRVAAVLAGLMMLLLCAVPVMAAGNSAEKPQNGMVVVAVQSGDQVKVGVGFAVTGTGKGAAAFITSYHLVADNPDKIAIFIDDVSAGHTVEAKLDHADQKLGFAEIIASTPISQRSPLTLGSTKKLKAGEKVYAVGFGDLVNSTACTVNDVVASAGSITDKNGNFLLTDCSVADYNVGGPLVAEDGTVLGCVVGSDSGGKGILAVPAEALSAKSEDSSGGFNYWLLVIAAAVGLVIAFFVRRGRKKPAPSTMPVHPMPAPQLVIPEIPDPQPAEEIKHYSGGIPQIRGLKGCYSGNTFPVRDRIVLGRDAQKCNIIFPDKTPGISALHCEIQNVSGHAELIDRGSSYGTFLGDGTRTEVNKPYPLQPGDTFYLGTPDNKFTITGEGL